MKSITPQNLKLFNENLRYESPYDIVTFAMEIAEKPIVTTSFGVHSAAILHVCTQVKNELPVVWCDTGYNTKATYKHMQHLSEKLKLNLKIYTPQYTTAFLDSVLGRPDLENPNHKEFSEKVKLEPFQRALHTLEPDVWFTNLRKGTTKHREGLDILSFSKEGILKVSPFYHFTEPQLLDYLQRNDLPMEKDYYDPVKALSKRECGIHFR